MKKIAAFTLFELLIGMIISSLVIGFGYGAYHLVQQQFQLYRKTKQEITSELQLYTALQNDFQQAQKTSYADNTLSFSVQNNTRTYLFSDSLIVRNCETRSDTFLFSVTNLSIDFVNDDTANPVEQISFSADILKETVPFLFNKQYSAEELLRTSFKERKEASNVH